MRTTDRIISRIRYLSEKVFTLSVALRALSDGRYTTNRPRHTAVATTATADSSRVVERRIRRTAASLRVKQRTTNTSKTPNDEQYAFPSDESRNTNRRHDGDKNTIVAPVVFFKKSINFFNFIL
jgi:hypothetical protein